MKSSHQLVLGAFGLVVGGLVAYALVRKGAAGVTAGVTAGARAALDAINPTNPGNVVARAADAVAQAVTGDPSASVGSWIYDITHPNAPRADAPVSVRQSSMTAAMQAQLGSGDKLTREDLRWMDRQLYGSDVQAADLEDAEQGISMSASNTLGLAAATYGPSFNMTKL